MDKGRTGKCTVGRSRYLDLKVRTIVNVVERKICWRSPYTALQAGTVEDFYRTKGILNKDVQNTITTFCICVMPYALGTT